MTDSVFVLLPKKFTMVEFLISCVVLKFLFVIKLLCVIESTIGADAVVKLFGVVV